MTGTAPFNLLSAVEVAPWGTSAPGWELLK